MFQGRSKAKSSGGGLIIIHRIFVKFFFDSSVFSLLYLLYFHIFYLSQKIWGDQGPPSPSPCYSPVFISYAILMRVKKAKTAVRGC